HAFARAREAGGAEARLRDHRAPGEPPSAAAHVAPGDLLRARRVHEREELGGVALGARDGLEAHGLLGVRGELQHAAAVPEERMAILLQGTEMLQRIEESAARKLR